MSDVVASEIARGPENLGEPVTDLRVEHFRQFGREHDGRAVVVDSKGNPRTRPNRLGSGADEPYPIELLIADAVNSPKCPRGLKWTLHPVQWRD